MSSTFLTALPDQISVEPDEVEERGESLALTCDRRVLAAGQMAARNSHRYQARRRRKK